MKAFIVISVLLVSTYSFSAVATSSNQVSLEQTSKVIPKRPPINDDGPGGGGPRLIFEEIE